MLSTDIFSKQIAAYHKSFKGKKKRPALELWYKVVVDESPDGIRTKVCMYDFDDEVFFLKYHLYEKPSKSNSYIPSLTPVMFKRIVVDMPESAGWAKGGRYLYTFSPTGIIVRRIGKASKKVFMSISGGFCKVAKFELLIPHKLYHDLRESDTFIFDGMDDLIKH